MNRSLVTSAVLLFSSLAIGLAGVASADTDDQRTAPRVRLGDLMTALVQPRHIKLGLARQTRNWAYLAYEWAELNESLKTIEVSVPRYHGLAMTDLLQIVRQPMDDLLAAIKARDPARFDTAYDQLTQGCNACHQSTDHGMVVIQSPRMAMFPDQSFAPQTD